MYRWLRLQEKKGLATSHFLWKAGKIEKEHEERYRILAENVKNGKVFEKDEEVVWQCANCGHQFVGKKAPNSVLFASTPRLISR